MSRVDLARVRGLELLVGYPWHWNAHMLELRARIEAGAIGTIEHASCLFASTARDLYRGRVELLRDVLGSHPGRRRAGPDPAHAQRRPAALVDRP